MAICVVLSSLIACLTLTVNGATAGHSHHMGAAKGGYNWPVFNPTPPLHLSIYNRLQVPLKRLNKRFKGRSSSNFLRMEQAEIPASSWDHVNIFPERPDEAICGFIEFEVKAHGRGIPIALYFSIPNDQSRRLPWIGIEMYTNKPNIVLKTAAKSSHVLLLNNQFRKFAYSKNEGIISVANRWGLLITAHMGWTPMNHFMVKLSVSKRKPCTPCTPTLRTTSPTMSTKSYKTRTTSGRIWTTTRPATPRVTTPKTTRTTTELPSTITFATTTTTTPKTTTETTVPATNTASTTPTTTTTEFDYLDPNPEANLYD